jgi:YfiH family protein
MQEKSVIFFLLFRSYAKLLCAFSTRLGGFSQGIYAGLNLGLNTGDQSYNIKRNRESFFRYLAIEENQLACGQQLHTANVQLVSVPGIFKETDALVTQQKNVFLTVLTADCFPVFLFDPLSSTVSIIHAGWRGTQAGIIENVFYSLKNELKIGVKHLLAAIGPGLQSECFEVREGVSGQFDDRYLSSAAESREKYLNLQQVILDKLLAQGVPKEQIEYSRECTRCSAEKFYSYRRQGKDSGRMMGIIGIRS